MIKILAKKRIKSSRAKKNKSINTNLFLKNTSQDSQRTKQLLKDNRQTSMDLDTIIKQYSNKIQHKTQKYYMIIYKNKKRSTIKKNQPAIVIEDQFMNKCKTNTKVSGKNRWE